MRQKFSPKDLEPACTYLRKSREDREAEARGEGETLSKHKKELFYLAKELNVNITKIFPEIESGESIIHRPEVMQLLKEVSDGKWRSVFCKEIDRLGRGDMEDQGLILRTLKESNTLIVTPRKIYDLNDEFDEEYVEFEGFIARKEYKIINRRLQGGRISSVKDGNYIATRPPYGYSIEKNNQRRYLVKHPDQRVPTELIWKSYLYENMGTNKIANELNNLGYLSYTGKKWAASSVLVMLKNPAYAGIIVWKRKEQKKSKVLGKKRTTRTRPREEQIWVLNAHEAYVTEKEFDEVQHMLAEKYHIPYQLVNGITNPLAGLVKCDMCGGSMVYRPYKHQQYPHIVCYNTQCSNKSSRFEYVEKRIIDGLQNWLEQYSRKYTEIPQNERENNIIDIKKTILKNLSKELVELDQQKNYLHELLEKKIYDEATYLDRANKLSERIAAAQNTMIETESVIKAAQIREKAQKQIIPKVKKILEIYWDIEDPAVKNQMLKSIMEYAAYRKEKDQRDDNFTLVLHPLLPR